MIFNKSKRSQRSKEDAGGHAALLLPPSSSVPQALCKPCTVRRDGGVGLCGKHTCASRSNQTHRCESWNERQWTNYKKHLQSDKLPTLQSGAGSNAAHPNQKTKKTLTKNISKKHNNKVFFISYIQLESNINSSTIYFYNHFKVPLIFFWIFTTVQAKHTLQSAHI